MNDSAAEALLHTARKAAKRVIKKNRDLAGYYEDFVQEACVAMLAIKAEAPTPRYRFAVARNSLVRPALACLNLTRCAAEFQIPKPIMVGEKALEGCEAEQLSAEGRIDIQRALAALVEAADPATLNAILSTKNYVKAGKALGVTKRVVHYRMKPVLDELRERFALR